MATWQSKRVALLGNTVQCLQEFQVRGPAKEQKRSQGLPSLLITQLAMLDTRCPISAG